MLTVAFDLTLECRVVLEARVMRCVWDLSPEMTAKGWVSGENGQL